MTDRKPGKRDNAKGTPRPYPAYALQCAEYEAQAAELDATAARDADRALDLGADPQEVSFRLEVFRAALETETKAALYLVKEWRFRNIPHIPPIFPAYRHYAEKCLRLRERFADMVLDAERRTAV